VVKRGFRIFELAVAVNEEDFVFSDDEGPPLLPKRHHYLVVKYEEDIAGEE
jgi:hypothetical protein